MAQLERHAFDGYAAILARPDRGTASRPGAVLVMPDAWGIGDFSIGQATRLANMGYLAMAGDTYGGGHRARDAAECTLQAHAMHETPDRLRQSVRANMDALAGIADSGSSRLAAIGYCQGGTAVIELARSGYPVSSVASFHGPLKTSMPASRGNILASLLICTGVDDPYVPQDDVAQFQAEMSRANADYQLVTFSGTQHSFTLPEPQADWPGIAYHPVNAARSWSMLCAFLEERLGA